MLADVGRRGAQVARNGDGVIVSEQLELAAAERRTRGKARICLGELRLREPKSTEPLGSHYKITPSAPSPPPAAVTPNRP